MGDYIGSLGHFLSIIPGMERINTYSVLLLFCLVQTIAAEETVYKLVDERGVPSFSDSKQPGSERISIDAPQRIDLSLPYSLPARPAVSTQQSTVVQYTLSIRSPVEDQVFVDNTGTVPVQVTVDRPLLSGHQLQVSMDGKPVANASDFALNNVDRGSHVLIARVVNAKGAVLGVSAPVGFHVRRHFIKPAAKKAN